MTGTPAALLAFTLFVVLLCVVVIVVVTLLAGGAIAREVAALPLHVRARLDREERARLREAAQAPPLTGQGRTS
ncbi:MAG: hypothetical protein HOP28_12280 [Gemmatimonadales bacterium]|nr:hypothetical protein [Gemmatimonadales bacterium]